MDRAGVQALVARKGEPATLRAVTKTRAATGGAVTSVTTNTPVSIVRTLDRRVDGDGRPVRRLEALLADAEPHVGDTVTLGGETLTVSQVDTYGQAGVSLLFEVTLL